MTEAQNELLALRAQFRRLVSWSRSASEQLQELVIDTEECGNELPEYIIGLIDEHKEMMHRFGIDTETTAA